MNTLRYTRIDGAVIEVRLHPSRPKGLSILQSRVLRPDGTPFDSRWYTVGDAERMMMNDHQPGILEQLSARAEQEDKLGTLRQAIIDQMDASKTTPMGVWNDIARHSSLKKISTNHLVEYLAGRSDMTGEKIDSILTVLGLTVKPK